MRLWPSSPLYDLYDLAQTQLAQAANLACWWDTDREHLPGPERAALYAMARERVNELWVALNDPWERALLELQAV